MSYPAMVKEVGFSGLEHSLNQHFSQLLDHVLAKQTQGTSPTAKQNPTTTHTAAVDHDILDAFRESPQRILKAFLEGQSSRARSPLAPPLTSTSTSRAPDNTSAQAPMEVVQLSQGLAKVLGKELLAAKSADEGAALITKYLGLSDEAQSDSEQPLLTRVFAQDPSLLMKAAKLGAEGESLFFSYLLLALSRALGTKADSNRATIVVEEPKPEDAPPQEDKYRRLARRLAERAKTFIPEMIRPDREGYEKPPAKLESIEAAAPVAAIRKPRLKG